MLFFLGGLPRSGSTVLGSILKQNPNIHVTGTSPTVHLLQTISNNIQNAPYYHSNSYSSSREYLVNICKSVITTINKHYGKPIVIDKNREWVNPQTIKLLQDILGGKDKVKIIATVRDIPDCVVSYLRITKKNDRDLLDFIENEHSNQLLTTVKISYIYNLLASLNFPSNIHFVEYESLLNSPKDEMNKIHNFLELPLFTYNYNNLQDTKKEEENDLVWNIPNLHKVYPKLQKQHSESSVTVLQKHYDRWLYPKFWGKGNFVDVHFTNNLDKIPYQITNFLLNGDDEKATEIIKNTTDDSFGVKFYKGYYEIKNDNFITGLKLLNLTRVDNLFHEHIPRSLQKYFWKGESKRTIVIFFEGSEGEQIFYSRYLPLLSKKNCKIVVFCSLTLISFFNSFDNVLISIDINTKYNNPYLNLDTLFQCNNLIVSSMLPYYFSKNSHHFINTFVKTTQKTNQSYFKVGLVLNESELANIDNSIFKTLFHKDIIPYIISKQANNIDETYVKNTFKEYTKDIKHINVNNKGLVLTQSVIEDINECNIIITFNSDICHFCGTINKEVWYIGPFFLPYLLSDTKLRQYKKLKIFKQKKIGDWKAVLNDVKQQLESYITIL